MALACARSVLIAAAGLEPALPGSLDLESQGPRLYSPNRNTALDPEDYNSRTSGSQGRGIKAAKISGISLTIYLYGASLLLISDLRAEGDE